MPDQSSGDPEIADLLAELEAELRRVPTRLRDLSPGRLARVREQARAAAQLLADAGAGIEARAQTQAPPPLPLPLLEDRALGDVVAVTGTDLRLAASECPAGTPVWNEGERVAIEGSLLRAAAALAELRRVL